MQNEEDLREFYITPLYLERMAQRVVNWSKDSIESQLKLFQKSIPDYGEVMDLLEAELHKRNLNKLVKFVKNSNDPTLKALLQKYKKNPDYCEVINTELEIRSGKKRLHETKEAAIVSK